MPTKFFALLLLALCLTACGQATPVPATLDEPFSLPLEQSATLDDLTVTFVAVMRDGRCPSEVSCAEKGFAEIEIQARQTDQAPTSYTLNTEPFFEQDHVAHGPYTIQLIELAPYPETVEDLSGIDDYTITLVVSKS